MASEPSIDESRRPEDAEGRYDKDEQEKLRKLTKLGDAYLRELYRKRRPALGVEPRIQSATETRKATMPEGELGKSSIIYEASERATEGFGGTLISTGDSSSSQVA